MAVAPDLNVFQYFNDNRKVSVVHASPHFTKSQDCFVQSEKVRAIGDLFQNRKCFAEEIQPGFGNCNSHPHRYHGISAGLMLVEDLRSSSCRGRDFHPSPSTQLWMSLLEWESRGARLLALSVKQQCVVLLSLTLVRLFLDGLWGQLLGWHENWAPLERKTLKGSHPL